jgi:putative DNA primase/helicase
MSIPPLASYEIARLRSGLPVNGEINSLNEPWLSRIKELEAVPMEKRRNTWDDMIKDMPDKDEVIKAVTNQKPTGPPPEPDAVGRSLGPPGSRLRGKLTCAAAIEPRVIEWLWEGRVPRGMLTMFAGDPKQGKSLVTLSIAAAVSKGAALPMSNTPNAPGSVILMSAEDDPARTIVPRLMAAEADRNKIQILESVFRTDGTEAFPSLQRDVATIEQLAAELGDCQLIVIDPVSAYLGGVDDHRNAELRSILSPLRGLAERLDSAVVLVHHLNKNAGTNGKYKTNGSIAYITACRANHLFVQDRSDLDGRRVLMLDNGGNLAPLAPTLAYVIEERGDAPCVEWYGEPVAITASEALQFDAEAAQNHETTKGRRAGEVWLRELLKSGPVSSREIARMGGEKGFNTAALNRAKNNIGTSTERVGYSSGSTCYWTLGEASEDEEVDATPGQQDGAIDGP